MVLPKSQMLANPSLVHVLQARKFFFAYSLFATQPLFVGGPGS